MFQDTELLSHAPETPDFPMRGLVLAMCFIHLVWHQAPLTATLNLANTALPRNWKMAPDFPFSATTVLPVEESPVFQEIGLFRSYFLPAEGY